VPWPIAFTRCSAAREKRRLGKAALQFPQDALAVAVDVRADLHDGCPTVTTRERHHVRFGRKTGDFDRTPGKALDAQSDADLLRHRRSRIVMQNDPVHREPLV
jgi:hypothetical protein